MSNSEKRRLALARAMLRDPRIVVLDEATSALDPESEALLRDGLDRFLAGRTVLVIAHRPSIVRQADLLAVLDSGRLECYGSPERCREESAVLRAFLAHGASEDHGDPAVEEGGSGT